jgi:hypothetical protein
MDWGWLVFGSPIARFCAVGLMAWNLAVIDSDRWRVVYAVFLAYDVVFWG